MTIAVLSALQTEIDTMVAALAGPSRAAVAAWPTWTGRVGDHDVVLAKAGLGKVNTAALAALIWERHSPHTIIFTGVAGGIDPSLDVGDIVIGERVIQHDWGVLGPDGLERYQAGHIPYFNPTDEFGFTSSPRLVDLAMKVAAETDFTPVLVRPPMVRPGTIVTGDQFLRDLAIRDRLFAELGAQAIEMEGGALGQVATQLGIDHLVIRSISDMAAGEAVEHFARFVPTVAANSARLVLGLIERW